MKVQVSGATNVTVTDESGNVLFTSGGTTTPPVQPPITPPTQPPVTPPTQPPSGNYPTPTPPNVIPWPTSGQVVLKNVGMTPDSIVTFRMVWKSQMDPNKFGRVAIVEEPGSAVLPRRLQLNVNGVQKFDSGGNDTAPTAGLCNAPTPGSPSQVQMTYDATLDIIITNGSSQNPNANVRIDIQLPDRY